MLLLAVACNQNTNDVISSQNEYRFYSESVWGETNTSFQDIKNAKLWRVSGNSEIVLDNTAKEKEFELHGDSLELEYTTTRVMDKSNVGQSFGEYDFGIDVYSATINDKTYIAHFRRDNEKLCFYSLPSTDGSHVTDISEDAIKQIAIDELNKRLGNGWSKIYTEYHYDEYQVNLNATSPEGFSVVFRRNIHGYSTEDYIKVVVSVSGEIVCFDARTYGVFDEVAKTVTKERLDAAKATLDKKLLTDKLVNAKIAGHTICVSAEGEMYLKAGFSYDQDNGERHQEIVYVSVV